MTRKRTPSPSTCLVLTHLQSQPYYGYALMKSTGLKSGTLYPILMRLTDRGFLTATWEEPQGLGRPPRQSYQLTSQGRIYAIEVLEATNIQPNFHGATP
ncbi:MAG: PadR family transcriptional regulator [Robiginitomaculum sp.]|nr:PadR family transcriptional regulator [Robiginitomaculum sp.]